MVNIDEKGNTVSGFTETVSQYIKLYLEDARLTLAEKLIRLLSAVALCSILLILGIVALVFVSVGVAIMLATSLDPLWALIIVASFYIVVLVLLVVFRNALLVNPISRFISRLILKAPQKENDHDKSAPIQ